MGNLQSAIADWTGEDLDGIRPAVFGSDVVELTRAIEQLDAERLRRLRRLDAGGAWREDGSLSTQAWLRRHCRMAPGAAAEQVRVARRLHDSLPETRDAFAAGDIGYAHVRVITRAVESSEACEEAMAEAEPILVDVARDCDPVALRRVAEHWRHMVDAEGFHDDEQQRYQRRRLHVSSSFRGMVAGDFELDPKAARRSSPRSTPTPSPSSARRVRPPSGAPTRSSSCAARR